jgi:ribonuclease HI
MELQALISALRAVPPGTRVEVVTDSEYVNKGVTQWMRGWIRNGWKTASKQPVKNQEYWEQLNELLQSRPHKISWVRGHTGHPENERCDELARAAISEVRGRERVRLSHRLLTADGCSVSVTCGYYPGVLKFVRFNQGVRRQCQI